ncbi:MAG: MaoC family dehydratase N-terminal domain-containing protein [Dehalococcoidia bacterium]|nr:MAG: MaoC family dehydratase N-terminal domain-containing protein [Dehalococcoidia bacterium]
MISEEVQPFIGKTAAPIIREVEKGAVRRYADAVGNNNPVYSDEEYAVKSKYGGIIAPPGFFGWPMKPVASSTGLADIVGDLQEALSKAGFPRILDGGISYEFFLPVRAGDTLVASPKVSKVVEKEGKSSAMMICDFETTYINQNGDMVARSNQTFIAR